MRNLRCTFCLFIHAGHHGIWLFDPIQMYLVVNWARKWTVFDFLKNLKISQYVLRKSITMKKFTIFFIVSTEISCPSRSFCTPYFWSRASWKGVNFVIVCLKKCIFFYSLPQNVDQSVCVTTSIGLVYPPARFARWGVIIFLKLVVLRM